MSKPTRIALRSIRITDAESSELVGLTFLSWAAADAALRRVASAGYCKVWFELTWVDGETYEGRRDLAPRDANEASILGAHVRAYCGFMTGREAIPGRTREESQAFALALGLTPDTKSWLDRVLDEYALTDAPAPTAASKRLVLADGLTTVAAISSLFAGPPCAANDTSTESREQRNQRLAREQEEARLVALEAGHWQGSKYSRDLGIAEISKFIKRELADLAQSTPSVLYGCRFSVRCHRASMCRSLRVEVTPPDGVSVIGLRWARQYAENPHAAYRSERRSRLGKAILETVEAVVNAYNFDRSDTMSDHFDRGFYEHVDFASGVESAQIAEVEAAVKAQRSQAQVSA